MRVVRSGDHFDHHGTELDAGAVIDSWEHPGRAEVVDQALDAAGFEAVGPDPLSLPLLESVHDASYLQFLETAWTRWAALGRTVPAMGFAWPARRTADRVPIDRVPNDLDGQLGYYSYAADCSITAGTWSAAQAGAAIAQTAADLVADGASAAFARCRPPGHHATRNQFGGYCYLNNAAIAAQRLRDRGTRRVAVLDIDYHHGNGTQDIFYDRADVLFASLHADPMHGFPFYAGHADEVGAGEGAGCNRNVPLALGTNADRWLAALGDAIDWIKASGCEATVVSLGVDTFVDDPISHFTLAVSDFPRIGRSLQQLAMPVVFVMEGGYATAELGQNVLSVLQGFGGE